MSLSSKSIFAALAGLSTCAILGLSPAAAYPTVDQGPGATSAVVKVHGDWDDEDGRWQRRRHHHHGHDHTVDAPFTHVETGRRVVVDAPFAHVTVDRYGRHIRAPFVNLWLPR